jgi:hypothetical protein
MGGAYSKVHGVPDLAKNPRITMGGGRVMMRSKAGKALAIGDANTEVTHDQVVAKEAGAWQPKGDEKWAEFQAARPYSLQGYTVLAPKVGDNAPDGVVHTLQDGASTNLLSAIRDLAKARSNDNIAVIFGCSTCPAFRVFGGYDFHVAFEKQVHIHIRIHINIHMHTHKHAHTHTLIHTYIHIYIHTGLPHSVRVHPRGTRS